MDSPAAISDDVEMTMIRLRLAAVLVLIGGLLIAPPGMAQTQDDPPADAEGTETDAASNSASAVQDLIDADAERTPVPGDEVRLYYTDGRRLEGRLISRDDTGIEVEISRVKIRIPLNQVSAVVLQPTAADRFIRLRSLIEEDDFDRRVGLAEWAADQGLLESALAEVEAVLKASPMHPQGVKARAMIESLIQIEANRGEGRDEIVAQDVAAPPSRPSLKDFPLLSPDEVNLMKVYEVDLRQDRRILIKRDTVDRLLARYADNPLIPTSREGKRLFHRKAAAEILDIMFKVRARELYREVTIVDQPSSMAYFRDKVHAGWLINSCATTRCHGGSEAGTLMLTNRRPTAEQSVYTNFLILDRFRTSDGRALINYEDPALSPLLHYGLPREDAFTPHPRVRGWSPTFRSREARPFRHTSQWIEMMYRPRPEYPIKYTSPGERKALEEAANPEEPPVER